MTPGLRPCTHRIRTLTPRAHVPPQVHGARGVHVIRGQSPALGPGDPEAWTRPAPEEAPPPLQSRSFHCRPRPPSPLSVSCCTRHPPPPSPSLRCELSPVASVTSQKLGPPHTGTTFLSSPSHSLHPDCCPLAVAPSAAPHSVWPPPPSLWDPIARPGAGSGTCRPRMSTHSHEHTFSHTLSQTHPSFTGTELASPRPASPGLGQRCPPAEAPAQAPSPATTLLCLTPHFPLSPSP